MNAVAILQQFIIYFRCLMGDAGYEIKKKRNIEGKNKSSKCSGN